MHAKLKACLLAAAIGVMAPIAPALAATSEEVDAAVDKAVAYLHKAQNKEGNWEEAQRPDAAGGNADVKGKQWGGLTSIATYALLAAGDDPKKDLAKPIKFLMDSKLQGIYATGLRCQVWLLDEDDAKKTKLAADYDREVLLRAVHTTHGPEDGFYGYYYEKGPQPGSWFDRSVSQYGVLGMWALERSGQEVPMGYWKTVDAAWRRAQNADGGWNYQSGPSTATMTAAGIATLFITQDYALGNVAETRGNVVNPNIEHGLGWMDKHIKEALGSGNLYGMYGIERIGVASGRRYFDTVDWYQAGADYIVKHQGADGSFGGMGGNVANTCFALLFLVRGRAPVLFNKVEYYINERNGKTVEAPWNERPRDVANFAHWMAKDIEEYLNWQIVNLKVGPDTLHDAPILYVSGNKDLNLSEADQDTLRMFVEQGGMILGNADGGNYTFTSSFEKLAAKLFPQYPVRDLPPTHTIYTNEQYNLGPTGKVPHIRVRLKGVTNGVRELMLISPEADMARAWQSQNERTRPELFELAANIFLYAVDKKNLQKKGQSFIIKEKPEIVATRTIPLARLEVGANWNPEPAGWTRMAALLHNADKVTLTVTPTRIDSSALAAVKVAHLTGTGEIKLTDAERAALKAFVLGGGTLIVDAAGGNVEFAESAEAQLKAAFGEDPELLPPESQVYDLPFDKIETVRYRLFTRKIAVGDLRYPRIKAISIKGRPAVFFSAEDLSAGIVGEPVDGIAGYDPASSTALMRALVMYGAFGYPKPPATQPATKPAGKTGKPMAAAKPVAAAPK